MWGHIIGHYFVVCGRSEVDRARAGAGRLGFPQVEVPPVHLPESEYIYLSIYLSIYLYMYVCGAIISTLYGTSAVLP